jgi:hypothetical protein
MKSKTLVHSCLILIHTSCSAVWFRSSPDDKVVVDNEVSVQWDFTSKLLAEWSRHLSDLKLSDLYPDFVQCEANEASARVNLKIIETACLDWIQAITPAVLQLSCQDSSKETLFVNLGRRDCGSGLIQTLDSIPVHADRQLYRPADSPSAEIQRFVPVRDPQRHSPIVLGGSGPWDLEILELDEWLKRSGSNQVVALSLVPIQPKMSPALVAQVRALEELFTQAQAPGWALSLKSYGVADSSLGPAPGLIFPTLVPKAGASTLETGVCRILSSWMEAEALLAGVRVVEPKRRVNWACQFHFVGSQDPPIGLQITTLPLPLKVKATGRIPFRTRADLIDPKIFETLKFGR